MPYHPGVDLIGDIHGCAFTLRRLLENMGYRKRRGVYRHMSRQVVFMGDIIDRGPHIREALHIVYDMVEAGTAQIIMGNHEYNALCYSTPISPGSEHYLRPHTPHHQRLIRETLDQFDAYSDEWQHFLKWFATLPLFLETPYWRAVHACWDQARIDDYLLTYNTNCLKPDCLKASVDWESAIGKTVDILLRGTDLALPDNQIMVSKDGHSRDFFRTKFWAKNPETYSDVAYQPDPLPTVLANRVLSAREKAQLSYYPESEKPLFFGHYWLQGKPAPIRDNLACLDYSAVKFGRLVAYRMDQETTLDASKFVWEYVDSPDFPCIDL